jgi:hypothetical protein
MKLSWNNDGSQYTTNDCLVYVANENIHLIKFTCIFDWSWLFEINKSLDVVGTSLVEASTSLLIDDLLMLLSLLVEFHIEVSSDRIFLKTWGCNNFTEIQSFKIIITHNKRRYYRVNWYLQQKITW